jgi:hypothetical protein
MILTVNTISTTNTSIYYVDGFTPQRADRL